MMHYILDDKGFELIRIHSNGFELKYERTPVALRSTEQKKHDQVIWNSYQDGLIRYSVDI